MRVEDQLDVIRISSSSSSEESKLDKQNKISDESNQSENSSCFFPQFEKEVFFKEKPRKRDAKMLAKKEGICVASTLTPELPQIKPSFLSKNSPIYYSP